MPAMIGERAMTRQEIHKRWRERNPEKLKEWGTSYYQQNKEKCAEASRRCREKKKAENPEAFRAAKAESYKRWRESHKEEHARRNAEWYRNNPDRIKDHVLKQKFGITKADYDAMFAAQNGGCAVCSKPCKSGRRLAVDHCHETSKVRGLLCMNCNNALGRVNDNIEILRNMIKYLER
jgi:hypothetical protein